MAGERKKLQKPAGATRREQLESKEGAIVDAAYHLFATQGFAKSTMSEIAKTAGVAEGTVYLYFNNKEALACAVVESFYARLTERARTGAEQRKTTKSQLEFLARHHLESIFSEQRILQLLSILDRDAASEHGAAIYQMNKRYVAVFDAVVRNGAARGDLDAGFSAWVRRDIFFGALEYAMRTMLLTDRRNESEKFVRELVAMIVSADKTSKSRREDASGKSLPSILERMEAAADRIETALERSAHEHG